MATTEDVEAIRAMAPSEINKMTNPQLMKALTTLINAEAGQTSNNALIEEVRGMREDIRNLAGIKQEVDGLSKKLNEAFDIITKQQLFLEALDNRERRNNLVILGMTEVPDVNGSSDVEKVKKVIEATGHQLTSDPTSWNIRRLGREDERKKRPILVVMNNEDQRNDILRKAKNLKSLDEPLSSVYIKKDVHPAVRKENMRLRTREREEKEKPENAEVEISYDWRRRVLMRDGVVIDKFSPYFF